MPAAKVGLPAATVLVALHTGRVYAPRRRAPGREASRRRRQSDGRRLGRRHRGVGELLRRRRTHGRPCGLRPRPPGPVDPEPPPRTLLMSLNRGSRVRPDTRHGPDRAGRRSMSASLSGPLHKLSRGWTTQPGSSPPWWPDRLSTCWVPPPVPRCCRGQCPHPHGRCRGSATDAGCCLRPSRPSVSTPEPDVAGLLRRRRQMRLRARERTRRGVRCGVPIGQRAF